jgi:hypothetical protein
MNIYIGCSLTHVPREKFETYTHTIHSLAESLTLLSKHTVNYALINSDPQLAAKPYGERARLCYAWDRRMVEQADVMIAESSFPSTGLGIEMQIADNQDIPIIICFERGADHRAPPVDYENPDHTRHDLQIGEGFVSLMALGLPSVYRTIGYDDAQSLKNDVISTLTELDSTA